MRNAFAEEVTELAENDPRIVLLSGDIGNRLFDSLRTKCSSQFVNCGVAEANMIGVAAGMALSGLRPITYTIAPFTTTRCLEQIRVDIAYHEAPVIIVGTGAGLSYASLGPTHHALEDFAILRAIPNLRILAPWDPPSLRYVLRQTLLDDAPTYIRIGKKGERPLCNTDKVERIGRLTRISTGTGIAIVAVGTIADEAVRATQQLKDAGISVTLALAHTVKPFPESDFNELLNSHHHIIIVEEHSLVAGFGESCVSFAHRSGFTGQVFPMGAPDLFFDKLGSQSGARERAGINAPAVFDLARSLAHSIS